MTGRREEGAAEPWDFDRFVELYNAEAEKRRGSPFDPQDVAVEGLERRYGLGRHQSLAEFARLCFEYDSFHR